MACPGAREQQIQARVLGVFAISAEEMPPNMLISLTCLRGSQVASRKRGAPSLRAAPQKLHVRPSRSLDGAPASNVGGPSLKL